MANLRTVLWLGPLLALSALGAAACSEGDIASPSPEPAAEKQRPVEAMPTFAGTVAWILQDRCQSCHSVGGVAPFPLVTYEDLHSIAPLAKEKVVAREMPPWGQADDDACKIQHKLKNDLRMTDDELATFVSWVDTGMPRGNDADLPLPKSLAPTGLAGKTDTFKMGKPYPVQTGGRDDIRCFPIDPGLTQDQWIGGVNVLPGTPQAVHHVIVFVDPNRESIAKSAGTGSYPCFGGPETSNPSLLVAWAPGANALSFDDDVGLKIPKNAMLVMQVHYHSNGASAAMSIADQSGVEIRRIDGKPTWAASIFLAGNATSATGAIQLLPGPDDPPSGPEFMIPANAAHHTESMKVTLPETIDNFPLPTSSLLSTGTHMHWAGVDMKVEIERKNPGPGQPAKECLVGTPKYDFNWQRGYAYDEPQDKLPTIAAGDTLRFTCTYNNTMDNKNIRKSLAEKQIASPIDIHLGEQTTDEMCLGALVTVRRANLLD